MSAQPGPTPRKRGRPRNIEPSTEYVERLENIVTVAAEVFRARGYDAGSLDDVAAELGLSKTSLYYYVKRKSDLLRLVFDRAISSALRELEALGHIEDSRERLSALIRHQALMVIRDPSLFAVFFDQRAGLDPGDVAAIAEKERRYVRQFTIVIEAAMKDGVLPAADPRLVANSLIGMTSWAYKWFNPGRDDAQAFADCCVALVVR